MFNNNGIQVYGNKLIEIEKNREATGYLLVQKGRTRSRERSSSSSRLQKSPRRIEWNEIEKTGQRNKSDIFSY